MFDVPIPVRFFSAKPDYKAFYSPMDRYGGIPGLLNLRPINPIKMVIYLSSYR